MQTFAALVVRVAPRVSLGMAALGLLACLLPWHEVHSIKVHLCFAPDCRSSTYSSTEVCSAAEHTLLATVIASSMAAVVIVQLLAMWRKTRNTRLAAGIVSLVAAQVVLVGVGTVLVTDHMFDEMTHQIGDLAFVLVGCSMGFASLAQAVTAGPKARPSSATPP